MNERLEREVLENVLDSDAIQHLLINTEAKGIASKEETLAAVNQLASGGYLTFSQYDYDTNTERNLDQTTLGMNYVLDNMYTLLNRTERTISRLNELNRHSSAPI